MTRDMAVVIVVLCCSSFAAGMYVGEEKPAVALKPCPNEGKEQLISATVTGQVCQYAEIVKGNKKIKWSVKAL